MKNLDQKINTLLDIIVNITIGTVSKKALFASEIWPIHPLYAGLFFRREWYEHILCIMRKAEEKKIDIHKLAGSVNYSSKIAQWFWTFDTIKRLVPEESDRLYITKILFELLSFYRKDIFCKAGKNICWENSKLRKEVKLAKFIDLSKNRKEREALAKVKAMLFLYLELIYFANHAFGHSFHGPYNLKSEKIIVREYFELKPEYWRFTKNLNFETVKIIEKYRKDAKLEIDFFERGISPNYSFRDCLTETAIFVDEKPLCDYSDLDKLNEKLLQVINLGSKYIQRLNNKGLIMRYAENWYYSLKPMSDLVGENWRPPKVVYENVKVRYEKITNAWRGIEKKLKKSAAASLELNKKMIKKQFDPRG